MWNDDNNAVQQSLGPGAKYWTIDNDAHDLARFADDGNALAADG